MIRSEHLDVYNVRLTTRAPLFIGSGKSYVKKEYVFLSPRVTRSPQARVLLLDEHRLFRLLVERNRIDQYETFMLGAQTDLYQYLTVDCRHTLQEILTVKSDDTIGRVKTYEAIVKGENIPPAEEPESFKVLVKEMKSLCLNVELEGHDMQPISEDEGVVEKKDDDSDQALLDAIAADAKLSEEESDKALEDIAAELGELMGDSSNDDTTNDLIGGEE